MSEQDEARRRAGQPSAPPPATPSWGADTTMSFPAVSVPDWTGEEPSEDAGLTSDQQRSVDALPAGSALLVVQSGPNAGARFLLDAERTTVGRHPSSDIFLDDVTVSRRHAEFVRDGDAYRVRDIGSLNGTYVNRDRVDDVPLAARDEVQIGKYRLTYHPHRPLR